MLKVLSKREFVNMYKKDRSLKKLRDISKNHIIIGDIFFYGIRVIKSEKCN